ncbi:MAG: peptide transporter [Proteobacteria bacterium]|nr:peptide transporter [Pseudomonadota bacterium]
MNHLIRLLASQSSFPRARIVGAALLSGVCGVLVLMIVNVAARKISDSGEAHVDWLLALLFAAGIVVYATSEVFVTSRVCSALEDAIHQLRSRLLAGLARADFEKVEAIGRSDLQEGITQATQTISQNSQFLALGLRSSVMVVTVLGYIAWISLTAFALVGVATVIGGLIYHRAGQRLAAGFARMMDADKHLLESLGDLLDGFQEVRLSSARRRDLAAAFETVSATATDIRSDVQIRAMQQFVLGQVAIYFMLAVVVFVIPVYSSDFRGQVVQVTTSVLFMTSAIGALIQTVPLLGASEQAAVRILKLEEELAAIADTSASAAAEPADFKTIGLRAVSYAYPAPDGEPAFSLGPVDLTVRRGEIIFITGGNGSGKSTLIRLITGLYRPQGGVTAIDGLGAGAERLRALVAPVFADCHIFPRLYGAAPFTEDEGARLLALMEMDDITRIIGDRFERIALSSGQRKRLALIAALLDDRPLLVLDEWAADQSPHFRRKFYREILPKLRTRGKTIIAVTHDDAYFDAADRRFHLEEGRLTEVAPPEAA